MTEAARADGAGVRSPRERLVQTLAFEAGGLVCIAPAVAWVSGSRLDTSLLLLAVLSVVVMAWSALFNTVFDHLEHRLTGRVASDRPHPLRALHAALHEATALVVSWPVLWALTDLGWWQALAADLALTLVYAVYAYAFHWAFDRLRPVRPADRRAPPRARA